MHSYFLVIFLCFAAAAISLTSTARQALLITSETHSFLKSDAYLLPMFSLFKIGSLAIVTGYRNLAHAANSEIQHIKGDTQTRRNSKLKQVPVAVVHKQAG